MIIEGLHEKNIFTEKFPFRLAVNSEYDFDYPLHWHTAVEIIYAVENSYSVNLNGADIIMEERDIVFIAGGDIHGFNIRNKKGRRFFVQFDFSTLESFGDLSLLRPYLSHSVKISPSDDPLLHKSLEEQITSIISAYNEKNLAYDIFINARVYDILVILSRSFFNSIASNENPNKKKIAGLDKLNTALKYIEEHYLENLALDEVSAAAGFSQYHFSRLFKDITSENFHDYINGLRIRKAARLLNDMSLSITQVAYASGFNSIPTFNRLFKKYKGCSPAGYRKMKV